MKTATAKKAPKRTASVPPLYITRSKGGANERAKARSQQRVVREPTAIFSGKSSVGIWKHINEAKTVDDLRMALYVVTCRCQELESAVKGLEAALAAVKI